MSCMDRVIVVDKKDDKGKRAIGWEELRKYGIAWYADRR
jgi:hypothetical protein